MAIECYQSKCPFHGTNEGLEGPFCYRTHCIVEYATHLKNLAKTLSDENDVKVLHDVAHILHVLAEYCEFIPVKDFLRYVDNGLYNQYDGVGYWTDRLYNEIGTVDFNELNPPENAAFVKWYAK